MDADIDMAGGVLESAGASRSSLGILSCAFGASDDVQHGASEAVYWI